jgi:hypothetical protein
MHTFRITRIAVAAIAATLLLAVAAPAAGGPTLGLSVKISPSKNVKPGDPLTLIFDGTLAGPNGGGLAPTITKTVIFLPAGAVTNGRLFPSCSAAKLKSHHNALSACPKGSKIGTGFITATAVQLGVSANANATMFNGPGGRSIVFNFHATVPADINDSLDAPLVRLHGKYGYRVTLNIPRDLQEILDGVFVSVQKFHFVTKASVKAHGKTVPFIVGQKCPKSGKGPVHADFSFLDGTNASADTNVAFTCKSK